MLPLKIPGHFKNYAFIGFCLCATSDRDCCLLMLMGLLRESNFDLFPSL